tara:strand:+ start:748 stop:1284 length:537 start_codon:yes stop_codon:yes gene_type:complete
MSLIDIVHELNAGKMPTVILIGNGVTAAIEPLGEAVDLFSEVIRFNHGVLQMSGREESIGTTTTTWVLNEDMDGEIRPKGLMSMIRILPDGYDDRFHADAIIKRELEGVPFPSSGAVMASSLLQQGLTIFTLGMDGYAKGQRNWWQDDSTPKRQHDSDLEMRFWRENRENIIPLRTMV